MNAPSISATPPTSFFEKVKTTLGTASSSYWATLIAVLGITIAIFTLLFYNYSPGEVMPFATASIIVVIVMLLFGVLFNFSSKNQIANTITRFGFSLYFFMPYALFTFGIVSDSVNRRLQYFPAGLAGFTGILFNYALSLIYNKGVVNPVKNALCEIPGLSSLSSSLAPQSMMFTLSVLAYIATYINRSNVGGVNGFVLDIDYRWPSWVLFLSVATLHSLILRSAGCITNNMQIVYGIALPLLWGGLLGFIGFSLLERSPIAQPPAQSTSTSTTTGESKTKLAGTRSARSTSEIETGTCSADAQSGEFTCE